MMQDFTWLERTQLLIGDDAIRMLARAHVLVVGMGGVGSFAAEFLARSGVGQMTIVDGDVVDPTNRNRQLPALTSTHGLPKVEVMAQRLRDINPELKLQTIQEFITPSMVSRLINLQPDFMVDAIDSITPKITLLLAAYGHKIPLISSMGAGGKLDPTKLMVTDISQTFNCPFAQQIRKMLKKAGIHSGITAVFSTELPDKNSLMYTDGKNYKKSAYGTISYLPAAFGAVAASVVIRSLTDK